MATRECFQARVKKWVSKCFGPASSRDIKERRHRFLEEALELHQSCGGTEEEVNVLRDYVFSRPAGHTPQEVGGVKVTLAALCSACCIEMDGAGEDELARIEGIVEQIRAKHNRKPRGSPLPGATKA